MKTCNQTAWEWKVGRKTRKNGKMNMTATEVALCDAFVKKKSKMAKVYHHELYLNKQIHLLQPVAKNL